MELPTNVKELLDKYLDPNGEQIRTFNWLPGYISHIRISNAKILQDKINQLGLSKIQIPRKYSYKDYTISELINGESWLQSQRC